MKEIILASASPRRKELLAQIGLPFQIIKSKGEEQITKSTPSEVVRELAEAKALEIWGGLSTEEKMENVVIGADTIVAIQDQIMGKPSDRNHAEKMLTQLQAKTHQVYTGVSFLYLKDGKEIQHTFFECTDVSLYPMTTREIEEYIQTGDPFDKAGAYGIQGSFAAFVKGIQGDYNNVVGLPVGRVYQELKQEGLH